MITFLFSTAIIKALLFFAVVIFATGDPMARFVAVFLAIIETLTAAYFFTNLF